MNKLRYMVAEGGYQCSMETIIDVNGGSTIPTPFHFASGGLLSFWY